MIYQKTNWSTAKITPENFNKMQTQYQYAIEEATGSRLGSEIIAQHVSDFPAHEPGKPKIIYHTGLKMFFFSTGSEWHLEPKAAQFGNAELFDYVSSENITLTNNVGDTVVRNYRSLYLTEGHILTTQNPAHALVIRAWGDITIDGTINMSKKGGYGARYVQLLGKQYDLLGGDGGNGGNGAGANGGLGGTQNANHDCAGGRRGGGGGGGDAGNGADGGNGGAKNTRATNGANAGWGVSAYSTGVSVFTPGNDGSNGSGGSAGAGSAGSPAYYQTPAKPGHGISGSGGRSINGGSGGGSGAAFAFEVTAGSQNGKQGELPGGCIILMALGKIVINGQILADGGVGGDGSNGIYNFRGEIYGANNGGGGGGSGGGKILAIHRRGFHNNGVISATGGQGGTGGSFHDWGGSTLGENGASGNNGDIEIVQHL
jgi:hypothetical protein